MSFRHQVRVNVPYQLFSDEFKEKFNQFVRFKLNDSEDGGLFKIRF